MLAAQASQADPSGPQGAHLGNQSEASPLPRGSCTAWEVPPVVSGTRSRPQEQGGDPSVTELGRGQQVGGTWGWVVGQHGGAGNPEASPLPGSPLAGLETRGADPT